MGALFGVIGAVPEAEVEEMAMRLQHRGARTFISRISDRLVLGSVATRPENQIHRSNGVSLVCDIGIINASELRKQVRRRHSDNSEISPAQLLHSLYLSGENTGLEQVSGIYAYVLVNEKKREITFGRDYFGSTPLFYSKLTGGGIAFASEYKALLCLRSVPRQVDLNALQHLQCNKSVPAPATLIKGIRSAAFGGITTFHDDGRKIDSHLFPCIQVKVKHRSENEAAQQLAHELTNAVKRQCADNERIGIALSGGIDSISIACILRNLYPEREIHTFTAGNSADDPEIVTANRVARHINSSHHEILTPADLLQTDLRRVIWHLEDPIARSEVMQLFKIGEAAGNHVDVIISGQGADSLFGGMPRYKLLWLIKPFLRLSMLRKPLTEFYNRTQLGLKPRSIAGRVLDLAYYRGKFPEVPQITGAKLPEPISLPPVSDEFVNINMARRFQRGQCQDFPKYERGFAAFGVQYRSAFCDESFARFAFTISDSLKIRRGRQKYILRKAMRSIVPDELLQAPKYMQTMRHDEQFSDILDAVSLSALGAKSTNHRGFFQTEDIEDLQRRCPGVLYSRDTAMRLWTILVTELWAQELLDKP